MELFQDRKFNKKLFTLVLPIAFQNLMHALVGATDAFILGLIDQDSMAAVSLATQIEFVMGLFVSAIITGTSVLASQYYGKGDLKTVQTLFSSSIRYTLLISTVFFLLTFFIPTHLMRIYTNDENLIRIGAGYLKTVSWSYLLSGVARSYLCIMKISERTFPCAVISIVVVVSDMVLDAFFVLGLFGFPRLGAVGSAVSSVIVLGIQFIWVIADSLTKNHIRPNFKAFFTVSPALERDLWKIASPAIINNLIWGIGFSSYSAISGHLGSDAAAASSLGNVIKELISCLCYGLGSGADVIIGHALGRNDMEQAKLYGSRLSKFAVLCGIISALILLLLRPVLLNLFVLSDIARGYLQQMLVICAVYMFAKSLNVIVVCGIFAAGGDIAYDAISTGISMWLFSIPLGFLAAFVFHWPVIVVYLIISADEIIKIPWIYPRYKKYIWLKNLTRDQIAGGKANE